MGEALIVRRGGSSGGGGDFSLEYVETVMTYVGTGTVSSRALDPSATYVLSLAAANADDGEADASCGVYVLENGIITTIREHDSFLSQKAVTFDATTNKIKLKCVGTYYGSTWQETNLAICKVV